MLGFDPLQSSVEGGTVAGARSRGGARQEIRDAIGKSLRIDRGNNVEQTW